MENFKKLLSETKDKLEEKKKILKRDMINRHRLYVKHKMKDFKPNLEHYKLAYERTGESTYEVIDHIDIINKPGGLTLAYDPFEKTWVIDQPNQMEYHKEANKALARYFFLIQLNVKL